MLYPDTREGTEKSAQCPVKDVSQCSPGVIGKVRDIVHGDCIDAGAVSNQPDCTDEKWKYYDLYKAVPVVKKLSMMIPIDETIPANANQRIAPYMNTRR